MKANVKNLLPLIILLMHETSHAQMKPVDKKPADENYIKFDDTRNTNWPSEFEVVEIVSAKDQAVQKAYIYKAKAHEPKPLIVSLHTWSGDYSQKDELAQICRRKDLNYIHPDFRGPNVISSACCSELALTDIDDAISYAIKNANVDISKIYVIGVSGGGYATLAAFMKSRHKIKKFSAWASISDLPAWYQESRILGNKYADNILSCTDSKGELNVENAKQKSPLYMKSPVKKLENTELHIFAGVYDGIQGSVPITHSINFYNKILTDLSVQDKSKYVSDSEKLELLEFRRPLAELGIIAGRKVCLKKEHGNLRLTIFEGNHEMLSEFAMNELLDLP